MRKSVSSRNASQPMTAERVSELKYEFGNLEAVKECFEEICGEINLRNAMEFLSLSILTARHNIEESVKKTPINQDVQRELDNIGMASDLMSFLANIHDEVKVLPIYVENVKDLLNQLDVKGGDGDGN